MSIIQSFQKIRKKVESTEQEKTSHASSKNNVDFRSENVTTRNEILKNSANMDHRDTHLGKDDFNHVSELVAIAQNKERGPYKKYTDKARFNIGKYASENGPIAAVRKFRPNFPNLNESTARSMRKKYEEELNQALQEKRAAASVIESKKRGRPLLLGDLDGMVQNYLKVKILCYYKRMDYLSLTPSN